MSLLKLKSFLKILCSGKEKGKLVVYCGFPEFSCLFGTRQQSHLFVCLLHRDFLQLLQVGDTPHFCARASHCGGFSYCGAVDSRGQGLQ